MVGVPKHRHQSSDSSNIDAGRQGSLVDGPTLPKPKRPRVCFSPSLLRLLNPHFFRSAKKKEKKEEEEIKISETNTIKNAENGRTRKCEILEKRNGKSAHGKQRKMI